MFITEVVCPQFSVLTSPVQEAEIGPVVLSWLDPPKKIELAFGHEITFVLRSDNKDYAEKLRSRLEREEHYLDLLHQTCMDVLAATGVLISTWTEESSGINAFEAAE